MRSLEYYLIVFHSQNHAYFLEKYLIKEGFDVEYLQAPKYLTKSCSASLKVTKEALGFVREMIYSSDIQVYKIYKHCYSNGKKVYRVINI